MSDREAFEKRFPVPEGVKWSEKAQDYTYEYLQALRVCCTYSGKWEAWQAARAQQGEGVDLTEFGKGEFVVAAGHYGKKPAVFIAPVQNGSGVVGESSRGKEPIGAPHLLPGERVLTFPTEQQAIAVSDALCNQDTTPPSDKPEWHRSETCTDVEPLLSQFHAEIWQACEEGRDYDMAGTDTGKSIIGLFQALESKLLKLADDVDAMHPKATKDGIAAHIRTEVKSLSDKPDMGGEK
jgi:hypothetical protein